MDKILLDVDGAALLEVEETAALEEVDEILLEVDGAASLEVEGNSCTGSG